MAVLEIKNLSVYYDKKQILENISLSIPQQKITAIIGPVSYTHLDVYKRQDISFRGD